MRRRVVILAWMLAACGQKEAAHKAGVDAAAATPRAQGLIDAASHGKYEGLQRAVRKKELTEAEVLAIIRALPSVPAAAKAGEADPQAAIADVIGEVEPKASYAEPLEAASRAVRDDARWFTLYMLVAQPGGLERFFPLAREMGDGAAGGFAHLSRTWDHPKLDATQIDELLGLAGQGELVDDVAPVALTLADAGELDAAKLEPWHAAYIVDYQRARLAMQEIRTHPGDPYDDPAYIDAGTDANNYLDLFKYFDGKEEVVGPYLDEAMFDRDLLTTEIAVISNVWLHRSVDATRVLHVAELDSLRSRLYGNLAAAGRPELMPAEYRTQEQLARADLYQWVEYRAGRAAPETIELLKVVGEYHVLRFRETADGPWYGAVAGAYPAEGAPHAFGTITGSMYEPVGDQTPEQILERWKQYNEADAE